MNPAEYKILQRLRANARSKLTTMSRNTHIPISTIFDKIRQLDGRLIRKFTVLLAFERMGLYSALMVLKVHPEQKAALLQRLKKNPAVNNLRRINNGYDFLVEMVFANMRELDGFLEKIEQEFKLRKKEVFFVLDDIKRETYLSDDLVVHEHLIGS
ncbi:MAG: Lrp/AsnC family transcriptional regulator [DPANN group archaeon]|nr:Lrp/AsnC family transcriptional regulator [DPANN group archaeon]